MEITNLSISEIASQIQQKKLSAHEVASAFVERIEKYDSKINSYVLRNEEILNEAKALDLRLAKGEKLGSLAGVPLGIKDIFCTRGLRTTACSRILGNFVPPYDSSVIAKLKNAGALILGKLNMDEFAMGSSNETSAFGPVKNPWKLSHVPGGSSGGSAAAQAARLCAGALGTDTGGSIRQPASFCGIVGVKPTYGRCSRYGMIAYASSLDQAGPMTTTVEDAALMLEVMSGADPLDQTTSQVAVPTFFQSLTENVKGLRVGVLKEFMASEGGLHPDTQKTTLAAVEALRKAGAIIAEVSVPLASMSVPVYYLVASSEASSNLSRYDGVKYGHRAQFKSLAGLSLDDFYKRTRGEGFGSEVKRRIMLGTFCLSSGYYDAYYIKASQIRRMIREQYLQAFLHCDVILSPVSTSPAFEEGARIEDPLAMYLNDVFTVSTNLAGLPGMSVPFGLSSEGLPIGVQLQAAHFQEQKMLNAGFALQQASALKGQVANDYL